MALKLGIQLYSVKQTIPKNTPGTLKQLADMGYKYLEGANHNADKDPGVGFGVPAGELRRNLEDLGLSIVGCHINPLRPEAMEKVLDYHQELGNPQIGCDIEFYPYGDLDYLKRRCEIFNSVGERCARRGMRFYYHNHYQEFQSLESGQMVYDFILEHTDPNLVFLEMDTYWIARGGQDPVNYIQRYKDRLLMLHQKDFPVDSPQNMVMYDGIINAQANITMEVFSATKNPLCYTEIGRGILPIQDYIDAAAGAPLLEYILLEQDSTVYDEMDSVQMSMEGFQKFAGVEK